MGNAISTFSIFEKENLDLKSLELRIFKLRTVISCNTFFNDQRYYFYSLKD